MCRRRAIALIVGCALFALAVPSAVRSAAQMSGFVAKPMLQSSVEGS